jgi:hypothetical protein
MVKRNLITIWRQQFADERYRSEAVFRPVDADECFHENVLVLVPRRSLGTSYSSFHQ